LSGQAKPVEALSNFNNYESKLNAKKRMLKSEEARRRAGSMKNRSIDKKTKS
jgi:hypothetical protein